MAQKAGVIGLGVLGKPVAERLIAAGFEVAVFDVRDEPVATLARAGAFACASPAEVASRSDTIVSLVSDEGQTNEIVFGADGILKTLKAGSTLVVGSTLGPAPVRKDAAGLASRGGETLDAPISGGYLAAYEGTLSLMIGGDP